MRKGEGLGETDFYFLLNCYICFPVAQRVKCLPAMRKTWVQSLHWEDPRRKKWQPTPVFLPEKSHGWRSLVGYGPGGCKESDTTERLHFLFTFNCYTRNFYNKNVLCRMYFMVCLFSGTGKWCCDESPCSLGMFCSKSSRGYDKMINSLWNDPSSPTAAPGVCEFTELDRA